MSLFTPIPSVGNHNPIDFPERYYVLAAVAFTGLYFGLSYLSEGYFQDDEVGHFVTAYEFWKDPFSIFTYWSRPGFKILYVIPALFGIKGVHLIASLIAGGTAYLASLLAKEYGVQNRILALVLCGFQPLFYQISFRTYAEIAGAFLLVLMLVFYNRKQFVFSAIVSSYLFSVRQELVILSLLLGVAFLWRREYQDWTPRMRNQQVLAGLRRLPIRPSGPSPAEGLPGSPPRIPRYPARRDWRVPDRLLRSARFHSV